MSKGSQRWGQALSHGLWADPGCCPHTCPHTGPGPHCPHGHDEGMWLHAGSSLSCHPRVLAQVRVPPGVPRVAQCDRELRAITPSPLGHGGRMKRGPLTARLRGDPKPPSLRSAHAEQTLRGGFIAWGCWWLWSRSWSKCRGCPQPSQVAPPGQAALLLLFLVLLPCHPCNKHSFSFHFSFLFVKTK